MTSAILCVWLRLAAPQAVEVAGDVASDPVLRILARVRLSPAAIHYLRTETFPEPHPRARCVKKRGKYVCEKRRPKRWHRR